MAWERGRARIEELLASGELEQVEPNNEHAIACWPNRPLTSTLSTASWTSTPPEPCNSPMTPPARQPPPCSLYKVFARRRTEATSPSRTPSCPSSAVPPGMKAFARLGLMRRQRHAAEYPTESTPPVTRRDADTVAKDARAVVDAASPS